MFTRCLEGGRDNTWLQIYSNKKNTKNDIKRVLDILVGGERLSPWILDLYSPLTFLWI